MVTVAINGRVDRVKGRVLKDGVQLRMFIVE